MTAKGHNATPEGNEPNPARSEMPLPMAKPGQEVQLIRLQGGRGFQHRLAEMGLIPGVRFRVLSRNRPGPLIISLGGTRLMLGHGMVRRVWVRPVSEPREPKT